MNFTIHALSRDYLEQHIERLILLLHRNLNDEYWSSQHFLTDLPGKWELSLFAQDKSKNITGFLIASKKQSTTHIHKFVVDISVQSSGLGTSLLNHLLTITDDDLSLKVHLNNIRAIEFYKKNGFTMTDQTETFCTMTLQRSA
jgi:ribosomal protein S18 acetylase RimI-like enzyme